MSKILIVEDNTESRYLLQKLLESIGHLVTPAEHGGQALRLAHTDRPDVIISDILMPVMNGFNLCQELKKDPELRNIPFIFYTATFTAKEDERLAMSLGASRFVLKPTEGEQFLKILEEVLDEHRRGILPIPQKPLEEETAILKMYDSSITRKLEETVEKLKKEQKALIESERKLKEAQEVAQIGHWALDLQTNTLHWSDEIYRIFGRKPREFEPTYEAFLESVHPDDRDWVNKSYQESLTKKSLHDIDHRLLLPEGTVKWVHRRCQTLFDEDGQATYSMGTIQDITARKRTEEAFRESEERFKNLFENAEISIWNEDFSEVRKALDKLRLNGVKDLRKYLKENKQVVLNIAATVKVINVNEATLKLFGANREDEILSRIDKTFGPKSDEIFIDELCAIWNNQKSFSTEFIFKTMEGKNFCALLSFRIPETSAGFQSIPVSIVDITERKQTENLQAAKLRLAEYAIDHNVMELLRKFLDEAETLTCSDISFFHFIEEDQKTVALQTWSTNTLETMCTAEGAGKHYPITEGGVWVDCIQQRKPVIHNDYDSLPDKKGLPEAPPVISELVVPVFRGEKIVAILGVGNKLFDYDENDIKMVQKLADAAWETVVRKRAEEKLDWELRVNKALAELGNTLIAPGQTIKEVTDKVFASSQELTCSEHGFISELDRFTGENIGHILTGMFDNIFRVSPPAKKIIFSRNDDGTYPNLWGHALNTGESFFTNSPMSHPKFSGIREGQVELNCFLAVPVKYGGEIVGEIALANSPFDYTKRHVDAIERLADLYALAIHRQRNEEDRLLIENQLRQAHKMEAVGTLAGGIAHDFNNILSAILGYTELTLDECPADSEAASYLQKVLQAGNRAKDLVTQILTFSRQTDQELKPIKIHLVIKEALKLLRSSIPTTIEIKQDIQPNCGTVLADTTQVHQIIMNLCTNAYHAMRHSGGLLSVSLEPFELTPYDLKSKISLQPGSYVKLTVSDTGCGIKKDFMEKIFEPYFTTKPKGEGTGLGLAGVHGIVKTFGGDITVYSEPDIGSTFCIYLPVIKERREKIQEKKDTVPIPTGNERILVVDDDEQLATMNKTMLESLGYKVTALTSSVDTFQVFQSQPDAFDLVLTDMTMPNMTGVELSRKILAIRPEVPIILCTGFSELINEEKAKVLGIRDYVMKPVVKKELAKVVREVLDAT